MKKQRRSRLHLHRETLRTLELSAEALEEAAGGTSITVCGGNPTITVCPSAARLCTVALCPTFDY